jgi:general secretion pathway protein G
MSMQPHTEVKRPLKRLRRQRGMTLVEIMVVLVILGLIATAVVVAVVPKLAEARHDRAVLDISNIQQALDLYKIKKGTYPDTASGLKVLVDTQNLPTMPKDPWGNDYTYMNEGGKPNIISYGADGQPGGEGENADISSKDLVPGAQKK